MLHAFLNPCVQYYPAKNISPGGSDQYAFKRVMHQKGTLNKIYEHHMMVSNVWVMNKNPNFKLFLVNCIPIPEAKYFARPLLRRGLGKRFASCHIFRIIRNCCTYGRISHLIEQKIHCTLFRKHYLPPASV